MQIWNAFNALPLWHRKMMLVLGIMTMMLAIWPGEQTESARAIESDEEAPERQEPVPPVVVPPKPVLTTRVAKVRSGDTLGQIFTRLGLDTADLQIIDTLPEAAALHTIHPGDELTFKLQPDGSLYHLYYPVSVEQTLKVSRTDEGFKARNIQIELATRESTAQGTITSSFWSAASSAGMDEQQILDFAAIFGWDIDFAQDLQPGDHFTVVYEEKFRDDDKVASGDILAAEFVNQGERYRAVLGPDGNYYTPQGKAMRKSFLRAPVNFRYISSNFNPRRLHPVTGKIRPHNGIDYVAPVGTPIMAAGSGTVVAAGRNPFNGNFVFIRHNATYVTKYLHLSKRMVDKGERVRQGETIGLLGGTGRVTGPHLHYEFLVNGVHKNPRTVPLPQADSLQGHELAAFLKESEPLLARLDHPGEQHLAMRRSEP